MDKQIKEELEEKEREKKPLKKPARPISLAYRDSCMSVLEDVERITGIYRGSAMKRDTVSFSVKKQRLNELEYEKCQYEA
ncbi:uncharacterized protein T551_00046 [Pneumocystis jirovecii RU7]|uniref:Uncharacterized protein n=1 Tax=Pneumocystis jirovecii (strain RU7) TaxID=1408657 RepID=A0A0W4ZW11_PNEJ7|nr:uncharacterized protein T551_00046 [Pneumocystis jirovecii RU7]KTW32561.1 hypothetical protein T551_00046 [Pneumocystis jirovecii RU7]